MNYYGQIDLTALGEFVKKHPELVRQVTFKDGRTAKMLPIDVRERKEPGKFGDVAYISCYDKNTGDKAYIADLKVSKYENAAMPQSTTEKAVALTEATTLSAPVQTVIGSEVDDLPF